MGVVTMVMGLVPGQFRMGVMVAMEPSHVERNRQRRKENRCQQDPMEDLAAFLCMWICPIHGRNDNAFSVIVQVKVLLAGMMRISFPIC